jgi:Domain of unknown function (DUF3473)
MVYFHPWELDAQQERRKVGLIKSFQHYVNLDTTEWKLDRLLENFHFTSMKENLETERIKTMLSRKPVRERIAIGSLGEKARQRVRMMSMPRQSSEGVLAA